MNTSVNEIYSTGKAKVSLAFLFSLAVLLLVVSCPLKRFLQNGSISISSPVSRTTQPNISQLTNAEYHTVVNCCALNNKTIFVKTDLSQRVIVIFPFYLLNLEKATGFAINYYLSSIPLQPAYFVSSNASSLPLFLQHLRLLI